MAKYFENYGGGVYASGSKTGAMLSVGFNFDSAMSRLVEQVGKNTTYAIRKAVDEVGNKTKTQVIRAIVKQSGVKYGKVRGAIVVKSAMGAGDGDFMMIAKDATLSLKEFNPRRTAKGVSANPWGKRRVFPHTFFGPNGHIFVRAWTGEGRAKRKPIHKLFGPAIPREMVKDEAERVFFSNVETLLGPAVEKWLMRQVK